MAVIPQGSSQAQGPGISAAVSLRFGLIASGKTFSKYGAGVRAEARGVGGTIDQEQPWMRGQASDSPSGQRLAAQQRECGSLGPHGELAQLLGWKDPPRGGRKPSRSVVQVCPGPSHGFLPSSGSLPRGSPRASGDTESPEVGLELTRHSLPGLTVEADAGWP